MISIKWVEAQIEETLRGANTAKNIYDLAMLYTVLDHLRAADTDKPQASYANAQGPVEDTAERPAGPDVEPMIRSSDPHYGQAPYTHGTGVIMRQDAIIWTNNLIGADGTRGPRWTMDEVRSLAEKRGYTTEAEIIEFWTVINMLRADYSEVAKHYGVYSPEFFADLTKAWINDPDAVEDKAAVYMDYIAK